MEKDIVSVFVLLLWSKCPFFSSSQPESGKIAIRKVYIFLSYLTVRTFIFWGSDTFGNSRCTLPCTVVKGYDDTCAGFYLRIQVATVLSEHNQLHNVRTRIHF